MIRRRICYIIVIVDYLNLVCFLIRIRVVTVFLIRVVAIVASSFRRFPSNLRTSTTFYSAF